jgi:hypothetical protein
MSGKVLPPNDEFPGYIGFCRRLWLGVNDRGGLRAFDQSIVFVAGQDHDFIALWSFEHCGHVDFHLSFVTSARRDGLGAFIVQFQSAVPPDGNTLLENQPRVVNGTNLYCKQRLHPGRAIASALFVEGAISRV